METKTKDLWVFIETDEEGAAKPVGIELLNPGGELAAKQGGKLVAVIIGDGVESAIEAANAHGADEIIVVEGPEYRQFTTDAYDQALCHLITKYGPTTVMVGATDTGRDFAPRVACRLQTGLTADCTELGIDEETGNVAWTRPTFGGNLLATILCPDSRPQMGTVRPGVFKATDPVEGKATVIREEFHVDPATIRTQLIDFFPEENAEGKDLEGAEFIVSGGRGTHGEKGFALLRELADVLDASMGASRAAVESGWAVPARQVGQTGKSVGPKVYIAVGISGAIQHMAGISGSDRIIAINSDPNAPIFKACDYGIVGDMFEVVPALTAAIKAKKEA
ncbi:electron transfer flavoprotein subunit alpha/FixB family protein [Curtanaerobium respiraculi]|uniref:electron transfer flavoprotein subunit alpha/FixB family protein n=1 Tax=Curtanaerobium respiraculi TaxID=2949669 RepID=UPI0024B34FBC|nr:electron transfer flavoprotein subunit alpha/FixB family protein [Curtanaerobium respiraculi]